MASSYRMLPVFFVAIALITFSLRQLSDPDLGFHLRYGKWIVENRSAPVVDHSTYTAVGNEYIDMHWLFQVILYGIFHFGGYNALSLMVCILSLLLFLLMAGRNRIHGIPPILSTILLVVFVLIFEQRIAPRPEMFSYLFLAAVLIILDRYSLGKKTILPALPLIMVFWCNVHALYILGIVGIVTAFLAKWVTTHKADYRFAGWGLLSVMVCIVNPYGWKGFTFPFFLLTRFDPQNIYNRHILEFTPFFSQPTFYTRDYLFILVVIATIAGIALYRHRLPLFQILIALIFLPLGILSVRNTPLFVLAAVPLIGQSLMLAGKQQVSSCRICQKIIIPVLMLVSVFLTFSTITNRWYRTNNSIHKTGLGLNPDQLPVNVATFITENQLDGRLLNSLGYGGWFSWTLKQPVFIDGRLEVFPPLLYRQVVESWKGGLPELIMQYKPVIIVYNYLRYYPWSIQLKDMPTWRLVYADGHSAVFLHDTYLRELDGLTESTTIVRNGKTDSVHIAMLFNQLGRLPGSEHTHANAVRFFNRANDCYHRGDITGAKALYDSALLIDPSYLKALNNRAILKASVMHDLQGALDDFSRAIGLNPAGSDAFLGRGTVYLLLHDTASACFDWQKAASLGNDRAMRLVRLHCNRK